MKEAPKDTPMKGAHVAGAEWPEAAAAPGDGERVAGILTDVAQVTDVGSLATVLGAVVSQCRKCRVKPEVVAAVLGEKKG